MQAYQREFPEPPSRSMTLNELLVKAEMPAVKGPGGEELVFDLAMTPGHVSPLLRPTFIFSASFMQCQLQCLTSSPPRLVQKLSERC